MTEIKFREELWKSVVGYEGLYEVSSEGRVKSLEREVATKGGFTRMIPNLILRPSPMPTGYVAVNLYRGGYRETKLIHRLVCEAFHGEPPEGFEVRHLNGVPYDNRSDNVIWGTPKENSADSKRHGVLVEALKTHCRQGHKYSPENTLEVKTKTGVGRQCKTCISERGKIRVFCDSCGASLTRASFSAHKKKFHGGISGYTVQV